MKKTNLSLIRAFGVILLSMLCFGLKAQTISTYTFQPSSGSFTQIAGTNVTFTDYDDETSAVLPIGFNFVFGGVTYTNFKINTNGWITFGATTAFGNSNTAANMGTYSPIIFPLWDDIESPVGGVSYIVTGTTPNRVLTVQWLNSEWNYSANAAVISFQVKLYETTNNIQFVYRQEAAAVNGGSSGASIGIATANTAGNYMYLDNSGTNPTTSTTGTLVTNILTKPATGQVYTFAPPVPCSGTPNAGTATTSTPVFTNCAGGSPVLGFTGGGTETGYSYQWQSSPHNANTWANVGGPLTNPNFTAPAITDSTDYRLVTTCTNSTLTNTSTPVTVAVAKPFITPMTSTICLTNGQPLSVTVPIGGSFVNIFTENFNGGTLGAFTAVNGSSGGTNAAATGWTTQPSGHNPGQVLTPPTATTFAISNSDVGGFGVVVNNTMTSPVINTTGYSSLQLNFNHYFRARLLSYGRVEVTTNGTSWTQVANYTVVDAGTNSAFAAASINLDAYANQPNFQFRFIYNAGYDWWWAIDDIALQGITTQTVAWSAGAGAGLPAGATTPSISNANITVTPTATGTYTYTATTANCGTAQATVTVTPAPFAAFATTADSVCSGTPATINVTGTPNAVVTFFDGVSNQTILTDGTGNGSYTTPVLATGTYTYSMVSVQGTTCTVNNTGTMTVESTPRPTGTLTGVSPAVICNGTSAVASFAAINSYTWPATVYYNNTVAQNSFSTNNNSENINVSPSTGTYVYTIDMIVDAQGCTSLPGTTPGSFPLQVNPSPSATISANAPSVCSGDAVTYTINFTGTGPWTFTYTDGTNPVTATALTSPYTFTTNLTSNTTYSITALSDASGCAALPADYSSTSTVTIGSPATVTDPSSTATLCTGSSASFTVSSTGLNVTYQWLENGVLVNNGGVYSGANTNTLMISNVAGLTGNVYEAIAIGQCGIPDTSNGATLTVTSTNNWSGTVSTSWNDGANWSCGTVPVITTDVIIPISAPFMPLVDAPGGMANSVTINGGTLAIGFGQELELDSSIVINSGIFNAANGKLNLSGNGAQNIPGTMYMDLEVSGPGLKTLDANAMVDNMLTLTNGLIQLNNFNLTLGAPELTSGGNTSSYVLTNGTGELIGINIDGVDSVTFHVGATTTAYNPLGLSNAGTVDNFGVRALDNVYVDGTGTNPAQVTFPVIDNTWIVTEGTAGGSYVRLKPYFDPNQGINGFNFNYAYGAQHDGTMWEAMIDSTSTGTVPFGNFSPYYIVLDSVQTFGSFAVASGTQFPLAVVVTDITATNAGTRNKVDWKSSAETTGDKYELQRSIDGKSFATIATISAKGEASTYTYWDATPVTGANYYRVKMTDLNGKSGYTKVVSATVIGASFSVEVYPNPVSSVVTVQVNGTMAANASVVITDVTGKVIRTVALDNNKSEINIGDVASGVYFIKYSDDVNHESIKINKQ